MKIVLMLSFIPALLTGMAPAPLAVVSFDRYTLVGNDGKEVVLEGDLVRAYLPELADKFRAGMIEGQTGKIRVNDLDGQALANLKSLIQRYHELYRDIVRQKEQLSQTLSVEEYLNKEASLNKLLKQQMSLKLESLPEIGDHFIALYKELVFWDAPDVLASGMAEFAAQYLELGQAYESFKNLDSYAQLLFLEKVALSDQSILPAIEWLIELQKNPAVTSLENLGLFESIRDRIIDFIASNIEYLLLNNYEKFKKLFKDNQQLGSMLKKKLLRNSPLYTTTLRKAHLGTAGAHISQLSDQLLTLRDNSEINNLYNFKTHTFSSFAPFKNTNNTVTLWGSNRIISLSDVFVSTLGISDLFSAKKISEIKPGIGRIKKIIPVGKNSLLILGIDKALYLFHYDFQKKVSNKEIVTLEVLDFISVGTDIFAIIEQLPNNKIKLILYDAQKDKLLGFKLLDSGSVFYRFNTIKKIGADSIGVTFNINHNISDQLFFNVLYKMYRISDLDEIASFHFDASGYAYPKVRCVPLNKQVVLIDYLGRDPHLIYDLRSQLPIRLFNLRSLIVFDEHHIAAYDAKSESFVIVFVPETDSVIEIFDEILRYIPTAKKVQSQKRPVSPLPASRIPAAAQGLKPQERETKRPREEKQKPNG